MFPSGIDYGVTLNTGESIKLLPAEALQSSPPAFKYFLEVTATFVVKLLNNNYYCKKKCLIDFQ